MLAHVPDHIPALCLSKQALEPVCLTPEKPLQAERRECFSFIEKQKETRWENLCNFRNLIHTRLKNNFYEAFLKKPLEGVEGESRAKRKVF